MVLTLFQPLKINNTRSFRKLFYYVVNEKTGRRWNSQYFITTPIFYVNAEPHIGHLYTALLADAANRFQKLKNSKVKTKFMVGTDEHGLKVMQSAVDAKIDVISWCDKVSGTYEKMFQLFQIEFDDFVRTTEERHKKVASDFWNKIFSKNLIYLDKYSGWYCVADEMFVAEHHLSPDIDENGYRHTLEGNKQVAFMEEVNYKFKLRNFQNDLLYWLKGDVVKPSLFLQEIHNFIQDVNNLSDLSVSRPANRVPWGIPVPGDPSQTMYVWMDALSSYLCTNGYPDSKFKWPPDVQIVGKDIIRFHCVFWPAFLMAADLEPPKCIYCHSHWLKDDEKMSKSKGNVVNAIKSHEKFTSDGLRYFLLRGGVPHNDGNFSEKKVLAYINAELCGALGNLLSRCTSSSINPSQIYPALPPNSKNNFDEFTKEFITTIEKLEDSVTHNYEELKFYKAVDAIMEVINFANKFFQHRKPWNDKKDATKNYLTINLVFEALRVCGILLQPIIPNTSDKLLSKLSIPKHRRSLVDIRPFSWELSDHSEIKSANLSADKGLLFPRIQEL